MDGYEFSLKIVRSPAVVALVTAIAISLGTGLGMRHLRKRIGRS